MRSQWVGKQKQLIIILRSRNRREQRSGKAEFVFIRRIPLAVYCVIRRVRPTNSKLCDGGGHAICVVMPIVTIAFGLGLAVIIDRWIAIKTCFRAERCPCVLICSTIIYARQGGTLGERIIADLRHGSGDHNARQFCTAVERIHADRRHGIGNDQTRQFFTRSERFIANRCHGIGNRHVRQGGTVGERVYADRRQLTVFAKCHARQFGAAVERLDRKSVV